MSPASFTVRVPLEYDATAKACIARIAEALDASPASLPRVGSDTRRFNIVLPPDLLARIDARRGAESVAAYASRLLAATFAVEQSSTRVAHASTPFSGRPDQERYYEEIRSRLAPGAIVLAEGSTGIGKGRVLGYVAATSPHALLATSTIKLVVQLTDEYAILRERDPALPQPRVFIGRSHFVSELAARDWIDRVRTSSSDTVDDDVRAQADALATWLDEGAPIVQDDLQPLGGALPGIAYLLDDVRAVIAPAAGDEVGLLPDDDPELDKGAAMYAAMREAVAAKTIGPIITTHAALAWDDRLRAQQEARDSVDRDDEDFNLDEQPVALFASYETLLIDEAHLYAQAVAGIHSATVAFSTLRNALATTGLWNRTKTAGGTTLKRASERALRELMDVLPAVRALADVPDARTRLPMLLAPLATALKPLLVAKRNRATAPVVEFAALLRGILNGRLDYDLEFSPHQRHPSLSAGPLSLRKMWAHFWRPELAVVLASATLYLPRVPSGVPDPTHTSVTLELPSDRLRTFPPVVAPWLTEHVALYTSEGRLAQFTPPESFDNDARPTNAELAAYELDREGWINRVASVIADAAKTSAGGMLVLCNSYNDIDSLAAALEVRLAGRLIIQARRMFDRCNREFRVRARDGQRPVWLATGTAWTGLDLSAGHETQPENDRLLTDLVIPRLPYGSDRSRIFARRVERYFQAAHAGMAFQLRQGIGRLIRRSGVRDRRLWILDGRIWAPTNTYAPALCRLLLVAYTDRRPIPLETKGSA